MRDVGISYVEDWAADHRKSLRSAYAASPFYLHYAEEIESLWDREYASLLDLNQAAHEIICDCLDISPRIIPSSESYVESTPGLDIRDSLKVRNPGFERYIQVFEERIGFQSDLSILDLLFCLGPQAKDYLLRQELS